ncbi:PREDICTED: uncharacterized protein LOC106751305 isoform X2 [Dinoponera quadriceps]|uniref:Uncharacterized protein LOC106751305 isoform X2 n=1 Tax=Dinoponera quadriceps TaxID=609295 RepID=A0A6P3YCH0_DINQU|nr:PREDICTED: uncharacterized protein LOC106751305 isoform X2 [Dinoponera quadriceps]
MNIPLGMGMSMSGFSLAINSYFTTKRTRAMALAVTITGLGPIVMPQVTSFLLSTYGIQGTILLFGAYSLHSAVGALLLQPLKWHKKSEPLSLETVTKTPDILNNTEDTSNVNAEEETILQPSRSIANNYQMKRKISTIDHDSEVGSIYGFDTPLPRQTSVETRANASYDTNYDIEMSIMNGTSMTSLHGSRKYLNGAMVPWWNSTKSVNSINLGSSIKIFEEPVPITKKLTFIDVNDANGICQNNVEKDSLIEKKADTGSTIVDDDNDNNEKKSVVWRFLRWLASMYDLDLLRDPIYVNMMIGMSVAIFAEANFSLLTPFILADMNMSTPQIASAMSLIALSDLLSRGASPFLGEWLHQPARMMYLLSLCLLIISRSSLLFTNSLTTVLIVTVGLGVAKGVRSVYMVLVIPSYVPIEKLPSASGIQMLTNGVILTCVGPLVGLIRDKTGSYTPCIILVNCVTAVTVIMWLTEIVILKRIARRKSRSPT